MKLHVADKPRKLLNANIDRQLTWDYSLSETGIVKPVCRSFLTSLFKISVKRIRVIQEKVVKGHTFEEK